MSNPGMVHGLSSPGLGLAGRTYAKRYRPWPPDGFTEPTVAELTMVLRKTRRLHYRDVSTEDLSRWLQVMQWFSGTYDAKILREMYDFLHVIRGELVSRKTYPQPLGILRCGVCSHGSERLWEATGETHSIIDRNDEPVAAAMLCARCWSAHLITEED
jgi:hypothetical protein